MRFSLLSYFVTLVIGIIALVFIPLTVSGLTDSRLVATLVNVGLCFGLGVLYAFLARRQNQVSILSAALVGAFVAIFSLLVGYLAAVLFSEIFTQTSAGLVGANPPTESPDKTALFIETLSASWLDLLLGVLAGAGGGALVAAIKPRSARAVPGALVPDAQIPPSPAYVQAPPALDNSQNAAPIAYFEQDNRGTRILSYPAATAETARSRDGSPIPFMIFIFTSQQAAAGALRSLPFIFPAVDTGNLVSTEVLGFGYYEINQSVYHVILCGFDIRMDLWLRARQILEERGGRLINCREPELPLPPPPPAIPIPPIEAPQAGPTAPAEQALEPTQPVAAEPHLPPEGAEQTLEPTQPVAAEPPLPPELAEQALAPTQPVAAEPPVPPELADQALAPTQPVAAEPMEPAVQAEPAPVTTKPKNEASPLPAEPPTPAPAPLPASPPAPALQPPVDDEGDFFYVKEYQEYRDVLVNEHTERITLTYRLYKANSVKAAMRFLSMTPVDKKFFYLVVETPEGNICRDMNGIYRG